MINYVSIVGEVKPPSFHLDVQHLNADATLFSSVGESLSWRGEWEVLVVHPWGWLTNSFSYTPESIALVLLSACVSMELDCMLLDPGYRFIPRGMKVRVFTF